MPTIEIDFDVYCDTCGNGLCNKTNIVSCGWNKRQQVRIEACPKCMKEKDNEIAALEKRIEQLESKLDEET